MESLWQHKISLPWWNMRSILWWVHANDFVSEMVSCMWGTTVRMFLWIKIFYKSVLSTLTSDTAWNLWHIFLFVRSFYEKLPIYWDPCAFNSIPLCPSSCDLLLDFYISLASSTPATTRTRHFSLLKSSDLLYWSNNNHSILIHRVCELYPWEEV